jgi:zeaxanthin glucosyltransferase
LYLIAEACLGFDLQLVISLGGKLSPDDFADLPGKPLVAAFVPQLELLPLASIVITHGGFNTVIEALLEGKPMVIIPHTLDQPAVAARVACHGAAKVLPVMHLSARNIRAAASAVLYDRSFKDAALRLRHALQALRGAECAADIVERAMLNRV